MVGLLGLSAPDVAAVGGNCSTVRESQVVNLAPDNYRVRASCASLQADSKARGVLDRTGGIGSYTGWFTTLNKYYYSSWGNCMLGCTARAEIRGV